MYVTSALFTYMDVHSYHAYMHRHSAHACFRCLDACPPIMHAYIATTPLIVHARVSISLSSMYPHCALLMYMNVHSYHACYEPFRCSRLHEHIV